VKLGLPGVGQLLRAGVNDVGGTLMDENISRAAGASHGQRVDENTLEELVTGIGRRLRRRSTGYELLGPGAVGAGVLTATAELAATPEVSVR
jgi:FO synthase